MLLISCFCAIVAATTIPSNSGPLDQRLAHFSLNGTNKRSSVLSHSLVTVSCGAVLSVHHTDPDYFPDAGTDKRPILSLNHGYPETSYIWRKITPEVSKRVPVVVADRPGYGRSSSCLTGTDERTVATALLEAVTILFGRDKTVILAGHDRGARAMHRAAVDAGQNRLHNIKAAGAFLADIVPIVTEYASFKDPNAAVGYFHWSFLPRIEDDFALRVIMAYGGGDWVDHINHAGAGINETAKAMFFSDEALEVYHTFFDQVSVTNASIYDYWSGATQDYQEMVDDQKHNRKIRMPLHIEYSYYNMVTLGGFDVSAIWKEYSEPSAEVVVEGIQGGQGHFIVELAPQETVAQLNAFMDRLGVSKQLRESVPEHLEL